MRAAAAGIGDTDEIVVDLTGRRNLKNGEGRVRTELRNRVLS
jgi:hypothetical protein